MTRLSAGALSIEVPVIELIISVILREGLLSGLFLDSKSTKTFLDKIKLLLKVVFLCFEQDYTLIISDPRIFFKIFPNSQPEQLFVTSRVRVL